MLPTHSYRLSARTEPAVIANENRSASAVEHRHPLLVCVGPCHILGASYHDPVSAPGSAAAQVKRDKQIVVRPVTHNERRLNRLPVSRQPDRIRWSVVRPFPACQRIKLGVGTRKFAGPIVKPSHFDSVPKAAKRQPRVPLLIQYDVRINRIEIVFF